MTSSPSGIGHDKPRRVLAQPFGVAVDGFGVAAQRGGGGFRGGKQPVLPVRVDDLNRAPERWRWRWRWPRVVGPVALGVHQTQITNPVVGPVPVYVVYH